MNIHKKIVLFLFAMLILWGCREEMDNYFYSDTEEYVDIEVLDLLKENTNYSEFVSMLERHNIDTLFAKEKTVTLFVPGNEAMKNMELMFADTIDLIRYLISETFINTSSIETSRLIRTLGGKFATITSANNNTYIDDVKIIKASPLCNNGRYYEIEGMVQPLPNLYEYIAATNPFFRNYIDLQDSAFLDLTLSTPIGYNEAGQTVYDSVMTVVNRFAQTYFDIKSEFRTSRATMLLFDENQFNNALSLIAEDLNLESKDAIPVQWQNDVLFPYLVHQGIFWNELEYSDFMAGRLRNVVGDTVFVDPANIDADSEFLCSNGKVYNYLNFVVPDSLYKGQRKIQGEHMVISRGFNLFSWSDEVRTTGVPVDPLALRTGAIADNDSILVVIFPGTNFSGQFSLTFTFENVFPGRYRLLWRGRTTPSGIFEILVNGQVQTINLGYGVRNNIDFYDLRNPVRSITNQIFRADGGYNSFDILVEDITEYGDVDVTVRYVGPGQRTSNGFVLDYVILENF